MIRIWRGEIFSDPNAFFQAGINHLRQGTC